MIVFRKLYKRMGRDVDDGAFPFSVVLYDRKPFKYFARTLPREENEVK